MAKKIRRGGDGGGRGGGDYGNTAYPIIALHIRHRILEARLSRSLTPAEGDKLAEMIREEVEEFCHNTLQDVIYSVIDSFDLRDAPNDDDDDPEDGNVVPFRRR